MGLWLGCALLLLLLLLLHALLYITGPAGAALCAGVNGASIHRKAGLEKCRVSERSSSSSS